MRRRSIANVTLLALLSLVGCEETPPPTAAAPVARPEEPSDDLPDPEELPPPTHGQRRMHDRYDGVEAIREAIVRGDLDVARAVARGLERPVSMAHLPESASGLRDIVPGRARAVAEAEAPADVARAFAELVRGCGECHTAAEVRWQWDEPAEPDGDELPEHMRRHQWGIARMWEGLLLGDAARFDFGARALEEAPLTGEEPLPEDEENPPGLSVIATRIHARARAVRTAADMRERAAIYGELLEGCGECHSRIEQLDAEGE